VTLSLPQKSTPFCADLRGKLTANRPAFGTRLWIQEFESFLKGQFGLLAEFPGLWKSLTFLRVSLADPDLCALFTKFRFGVDEFAVLAIGDRCAIHPESVNCSAMYRRPSG
jgi:hypothetical protein